MTRSGFRNIRSALKSERQFHARWEKKQQQKLKERYGIENKKTTDRPGVRETGRGT
jgi:hypothetical protein